MISNRGIFFSGELPPNSLNGISYSNANLLKYLANYYSIVIDQEIVDLKYYNTFSLIKLINFLRRIINVLINSYKRKFNFFYIVFSNSLFGAIKTILIIYSFKLFNNRAKIIVHIHRGDLEKQLKKSKYFKFVFKLVLNQCNKLIVLSQQSSNYIKTTFPGKYIIISLENTVFNEVHILKNNNYTDRLNCIFISNYIEEKGILLLLESFKKLGNNYILNCYGSFTNELLKDKILQYESDNIKINGPIYDYEKFLTISKSDLLILPSFNEGKPIILLESMMLGTPFIASRVGYINEMVDLKYPLLLENINIESIITLVKSYSTLNNDKKKYLSESLMNRYNLMYNNNIYYENINNIFND
jgi:glycosyltransferase involved in cell wall biosynthesis